jgi:DoxX-like family
MNILLWLIQAVLALLCISGGAYKALKFDELAKQMRLLPRAGWRALGVLEIACGILLIVPGVVKWMPMLTPLAAAVLAVEALALSVLYGRYSLKLTASNPLIWSLVMALMAAFIAYGRQSQSMIDTSSSRSRSGLAITSISVILPLANANRSALTNRP